jgi:hypothetical protein
VEVVLVDMVAEAEGAVAAAAVDLVVQAVMGTGFALTQSLSPLSNLSICILCYLCFPIDYIVVEFVCEMRVTAIYCYPEVESAVFNL